MQVIPVILSWSGGKDAALALRRLRHHPRYRVVRLLTTVTDDYGRVSMHGVRRELLRAQSQALGLPLTEVRIPAGCSNAEYDARMAAALAAPGCAEVRHVAFGDLFLEDVRTYREKRLREVGRRALFPLWGTDTAALARTFVMEGFRAVVVCVDPARVDASMAGRAFDAAFLRDLPPGADPCGEQGEFHTFVWDGPVFARPVQWRRGEVVTRDGFVFCDLLPA